MARDLTSLFANRWMIPAAISPAFATLGVVLTNTPVTWAPVLVPPIVVLVILAIQFVRQGAMKKPAKIWRGNPRLTFTLNMAAVLASVLGMFYATRPWIPEFEVDAALALGGGCAMAGAAITILSAPIWWQQSKRGDGPKPFKTPGSFGLFIFGIVLFALMVAPMTAWGVTIPLTFLYIEEVASANPAFMSRHTWLLLLTLVATMPVPVIWAYVDMRKQVAKQRRG